MSEIDFKNITSAHFIGIGGIGISAVARMLLLQGVKVSGSDRDKSRITDELEVAGATIFVSQDAKHIPTGCNCVIYTVAIPENNVELVEAKKRNIPLLTYPQTLDLISKEKHTIAVSGTHGKTTTTAMVASILIDAGLDPSVIVGSLMKHPNGSESNFIAGKSKYLVVEADEYKKSFHNLHPKILVINNIDEDHLDFYKDLADIQNSFLELAMRIPVDGFLVCNTSDPHVQPVITQVKCKVLDYGSIKNEIKLKIPGEHNRSNARAALAVAEAVGIDRTKAEQTLGNFSGVWKRFEYKGKTVKGALVYDDYAHNPQKIKAALAGARELFGKKRIVVVFQPHLYSRTKLLLETFATSFTDADEIILLPIFAAREAHDPSISSETLAERIHVHHQKSVSCKTEAETEQYLRETLTKNDVLITAGAGEAFKVGENLLDKKGK